MAGLFSSALDFGLGRANAAMDAKITRGLRRTVYQDQMHSMRQAGLNPILAAGQQPGMGLGINTPTPKSDLEGSAKDLWLAKAQKDATLAQAREAEAKADTAEMLRQSQKDLLDAQARDTALSGDLKASDKVFRPDFNRLTNEFLSKRGFNVEADTLSKQAGIDIAQQQLEANVPAAQAGSLRASAKASTAAAGASDASAALSGAKQMVEEAREDYQLSVNEMERLTAEFAREHPDLIKRGMFFDEIAERAGPIFRLFIKSKRDEARADSRERRSSAARNRQPNSPRNSHTPGRAPYNY